MFEKIKSLFHKYRELISYVFFGGLTTVVSFGSYFILNHLIGEKYYMVSQVVSWILAVAFAFATNKKYVFTDSTNTKTGIVVQIAQFYGSRLFSFGGETLLLFLAVDVFKQSENLSKIPVSIITVILNYVTSKLFVFRKNSDADGSDSAEENNRKV